MGSVIVGTNRISDCRTLVGIRDQPLLQVQLDPLRVSLRLPKGLPSGISFEIVENEIVGDRPDPELRLVSSPVSVSIFYREMLLISAVLIQAGTAHLKIDLRPVGIMIFDDHQGLHVGNNLLARASFANCMTAISLG